MLIRFYGVRGSVPTPGPSTVRYGGNTVCVEVRLADGTLIVLDGGTGLRELGRALLRAPYSGPMALLLTHLHWDHVLGIPFFGPIWRKDTHVQIYPLANAVQQSTVEQRALFDGIHFPVRAADVPAKIEFVSDAALEWRIGSATITRIQLNHPGGAQGFRIDDADGASLVYVTDNELSPPTPPETTMDELAHFASGAGLLIHDAQYFASDMPEKCGWGHSTVDDTLLLAKKADVRRVALFHHDPERDDADLDALSERVRAWFDANAKETIGSVATEGTTVTL